MNVSRRHFLRTAGLSVALPSLPSLAGSGSAAASAAASSSPARMCYLYVPNGVNMEHWRPSEPGDSFVLNRSCRALEPHRNDLSFVEGLAHQNATAGRDGAGDHARANATFLTGARARKTSGADIHLGVSADQVVAQAIGDQTRLPSLELSCDGVRRSGNCDSGYACAYQYNFSWSDERTPIAPENNPRLVFERLFGDGDHGQRTSNFRLRQAGQRSMLDFLMDEVAFVQRRTGIEDRQKVDEYLTGLRDIESRIEKAERYGLPPDPDVDTPAGIPQAYSQHIELLMDVMLLAFETDSTRVCSFLLAHDGSNRSFKEIDISDGHHDLSHHKKNAERLEKIARIDQFYVERLAYFLQRAKATKLSDGSPLLDHMMVCYGSGISDGDRHNHDDLPVIVAGGRAVGWQPGRFIRTERKPMANLHVDMIRRMGVSIERFGDSDGALSV